MTSPERIEEILKVFDMSLEDLPKPKPIGNGKMRMAYKFEDRQKAEMMAIQWHDRDASDPDLQTDEVVNVCMKDFILHQSDVIEKLCKALEISFFDMKNAMTLWG